MRRTFGYLVPLALCGLAIGLATAAPTVSKSKRGPIGKIKVCSEGPPSADRCLDPGYLDGPCGTKYRAECKKPVEEGLKTHYDANPSPLVKMLQPEADDIPKNLRTGKVQDYSGPTKKTLVGTFPKIRTVGGAKRATAAPKPTIGKRTMSGAATSPALTKSVSKLGSARPRYKLGTKTAKLGSFVQTSDNIFARTGLTRPPHSGLVDLPLNAHRNPAWEANGEKITSCEEYAYEKTYDWARYTDAVAACAGDINCQLDIAFLPTTPGIASRPLLRKDGKPTKTQISYATTKKLPKNDFFAYGAKFVYSAGPEPLPRTPDLIELENVLKNGIEHYKIGCSKGGCRAGEFKDEWDFHRKLHDANRTLSMAEFEEYERRKALLRELISQHAAAVREETEKLKGHLPTDVAEWVNPIDMVTADPFNRLDMMREYASEAARSMRSVKGSLSPAQLEAVSKLGGKSIQKGRMNRGKRLNRGKQMNKAAPSQKGAPMQRGAPKGAPMQKGAPTQKQFQGVLGPEYDFDGRGPVAQGVLAIPPKKGSTSSTPGGGSTSKPQQATLCMPHNFPVILEMFGMGPISCQIGHLMRLEWERKKRGQKSCIDPAHDDCDWSPMMFEARFVEGLPYLEEQNEYENTCVDYTNDKFTSPAASITGADAYINEMREKIDEAMKVLKPYQKKTTQSGLGKGFGKGWTDADHFGDKSLFAAGYDYDLGWDVEPVEVSGNADVCQLGGGARGGFGVDGWFLGGRFEVVDALAQADYNRKGDKKGFVHAHLNLFESAVKVIDPVVDEHFSGVWEKPVAQGGIDIPMGYKPSFTIMAGPVPITGAVWGEFMYGAKLGLEPVTEASCDMSKMKFGSTVRFTPQVGLNAKAQVGVGISGLLSAGIRGMINLLTVGVPVEVALLTKLTQVQEQMQTALGFNLDVKLALSTLSGWIAVYVEFLFVEEEFVLFRWNGLGPKEISLLGQPLQTELPLFVMAN